MGSGNLTYSGLADLGGNDLLVNPGATTQNTNIFTTSAISSGTIYASFLIDGTTQQVSGTTALFALEPAISKLNVKPNEATIELVTQTSGSGFALGIINPSTGSANTVHLEPTVLNVNQTYLIVAEYNFSTFAASLFIDPVPGGTQPATPNLSVAGTTEGLGVQNVGFGSNTSVNNGAYILDNLIVGQTWSDVTPTATPEPSTLALSALGMLGLAVQYRRRRK